MFLASLKENNKNKNQEPILKLNHQINVLLNNLNIVKRPQVDLISKKITVRAVFGLINYPKKKKLSTIYELPIQLLLKEILITQIE